MRLVIKGGAGSGNPGGPARERVRRIWRTALSTLGLLLILPLLWPFLQWALFDAYWSGTGGSDCPDKSGACWPFIAERFRQLMYGAYPEAERWRVNLGLGLGLLLLVPIMIPRMAHKATSTGVFMLVYQFIAVALFSRGVLGLVSVATSHWGGLFPTLVIGVFAFVFALPAAILLALGRESRASVIRMLAGTWVEVWRRVPNLVVLFVAVIMLPLFLPREYEIDKLLRALVALSILMSCYIAEAVPGALRALPAGQHDATRAL